MAISFEPRPRLLQLSRQMQLPFLLLSDPERDTYRAYGLGRGSWLKVFSPGTLGTYLKLLARGRRYHHRSSDLRQLGGDFVIDRQGVVQYAYASRAPSDRPGVGALIEVLREV